MKAKLLKRMTIAGKSHNAGEVLEVKDWKNLRSLVSNRYIEVLLEEETAKPEPKSEAKAKPKAKVQTDEPEVKEISVS